MRKIKSSKLALNRETLRHLSRTDLNAVNGGGGFKRCTIGDSGCADGCPTENCTSGCPGTGNTQNCASVYTCA